MKKRPEKVEGQTSLFDAMPKEDKSEAVKDERPPERAERALSGAERDRLEYESRRAAMRSRDRWERA